MGKKLWFGGGVNAFITEGKSITGPHVPIAFHSTYCPFRCLVGSSDASLWVETSLSQRLQREIALFLSRSWEAFVLT